MNNKLRILICGSRYWTDKDMIMSLVMSLPKDSVIIEGEAKGADSLARICAEECDFAKENILRCPADWNKFSRQAGPIRNTQMLNEGKPTHIIAYSNDIKTSKGTKNMITQGIKENIPCYLNLISWINVELEIEQPLILNDLT